MKKNHHPFATLTLLTSLALAAQVRAAVPVTITNPGFENPVQTDGIYLAGAPPGWSVFNAGNIGVLNPTTSDLTAEAPEGANVGLVTSSAAEDGLAQTLGSLFQADATYVLTAKVANTNPTTGFPGYRVQLVANGTVLNEEDDLQVVAEDAVVTATVNYTYNAGAHAGLVGQPLQIRLLSKGLAAFEELAFDDVQLTVALANPVAVTGGPYAVAIPSGSLTLNGGSSQPSDGQTITTWEWDLDNDGDYDELITGATPATIPYATLTAATPTGYGMVAGANTIKLRVTDSAAKTATATTTVTLAIPVTTFNQTTNTDWNTASNWDTGLPTGSINMLIAATKTANNASATPATSTGKLTLNAGSKITVPQNAAVGENNVITTPSSIDFNGGTLDLSSQDAISFPALTMTGTGKLTASNNNGDSRTRNLNNAVSGSGLFTIEGRNRQVWNIGVNNSSFSGGLDLTAIDRYEVRFNAAGSAGTGNVTVTKRASDDRSAILVLGASNVFADTATLTLNGKGWAGSSGFTYAGSNAAIDMKTFSDTVDKLFVLGVQMPAGTYTGGSGTWIIGTGILTVLTSPPDTTPPTLVGSGFVDNKSGGPITAFETVTYTVTFSEPMKASSIGIDDFENATSPTATINSVSATANPAVFTVSVTPGGTGTLQLQVKAGTVIEDLIGNALVTTTAIPDDTTITVNPDPVPTLVSITDNQAGGPVFQNQPFTYFVAFDQVMNPATVDAADFENGSGPAVTITNVISTGNSSIFAVDLTPGGTGTITLQIKSGAVLTNTNGTALNTTSALPDDIAITVNAGSVPARGTITVDGTDSWNASVSGTLNAGGSDKLVVIVTGETGNPGNLDGNSTSVTYDGVALTKVVDRNPIGGTPYDQTFNDIWYLDNPATSTGTIVVSVLDRGNVTAFALSGTAPGVGFTAISPQASKSVVFTTTAANSIVIASHGMGGDGNTANVTVVDAVLPLIETSAIAQASGSPSPWDGHVTAYALVTGVGTAPYSFTGGNTVGSHTIAAEFIAAVAGAPNTFATWIGGFPGVGGQNGVGDDADGDGSDNGVENFFGTNPSVFSSGLVAGTVSGSTFTFTHPQSGTLASDLTAVYQWSKDLTTFYGSGISDGSTTVTLTPALNTPVAGTTTVTATVTGTATSKLFVNIKVTQP